MTHLELQSRMCFYQAGGTLYLQKLFTRFDWAGGKSRRNRNEEPSVSLVDLWHILTVRHIDWA